MFFRKAFLETNSLCFFSSERCLFPPLHTWRLFSLNTELRPDSAFPSVLKEWHATSFWPSWVEIRNVLPFNWCSPKKECITSLSFFFFFLNFRSLILMCLSRSLCLTNSESFRSLFLHILLKYHSFLSFKLSIDECWQFCYGLTGPWDYSFLFHYSFLFQSIFSLIYSEWVNCINLSSSSLFLSLSCPVYFMNSSSEVLSIFLLQILHISIKLFIFGSL